MKRFSILFLVFVFSVHAISAQKNIATSKQINAGTANFQPVEGQYITVNGINMYYESYGEGDPLLMIHGNGGSVRDFNNQVKFFSKKYRVIVADSRGQGNSTDNSDSLTYELMTKDFKMLLDDLEIDSAIIIGHSDGAIIGLMMAMQYPEKVKKLVAVGANLFPDTTAVDPDAFVWVQKMIAQAKDSIKAGKTEFKEELKLMNLLIHHPNIDPDDLGAIQIPVLVMAGDHDLIKLEHTLLIYEHLPMAYLDIVPNSTHFIPQESSIIFNNTVMRFLAKEYITPDSMQRLNHESSNE